MTDWRELNDIVQKWLNAFDPIELEAPTKRGKAKSLTCKEIKNGMSAFEEIWANEDDEYWESYLTNLSDE